MVEESYKGPSLESMDTVLTKEWVEAAIQWMKEEKKIHKKYVWMILKRISIMLE